jgi:hypothetical protein
MEDKLRVVPCFKLEAKLAAQVEVLGSDERA